MARDEHLHEDAQELFGRAGVVAEEVGDAEAAAVCCVNQTHCLLVLKRYTQALAVSEQALELDKASWYQPEDNGDRCGLRTASGCPACGCSRC